MKVYTLRILSFNGLYERYVLAMNFEIAQNGLIYIFYDFDSNIICCYPTASTIIESIKESTKK